MIGEPSGPAAFGAGSARFETAMASDSDVFGWGRGGARCGLPVRLRCAPSCRRGVGPVAQTRRHGRPDKIEPSHALTGLPLIADRPNRSSDFPNDVLESALASPSAIALKLSNEGQRSQLGPKEWEGWFTGL